MRILVLFILTFVFQYVYPQFDEQITGKEAIKAAYNINNSAVRIIKDYVYMNMRVSYAVKNVDNSFSDSEDALIMLEIYAENHPEVKPVLQQIINMRKKTRMMFLQKPKKEKIKTVLSKLDKLISISGKVIDKIKNIENIKANTIQENSHKIEFIAQQLSFMHALKFMGENQEEINLKLSNLEKNLQTSLNILQSQIKQGSEAAFQLKLLQSDWTMYKKIAAKKNQRFINTLYTLLDKISDNAAKLADK